MSTPDIAPVLATNQIFDTFAEFRMRNGFVFADATVAHITRALRTLGVYPHKKRVVLSDVVKLLTKHEAQVVFLLKARIKGGKND